VTKIGIAISAYDKFEELDILLDIIKSWKGDYVTGLCCNHPDGKKYQDKVDYYIQGDDIPFKSYPGEATFFFKQDENYYIRLRAANCVRLACSLLTDFSDCDYIVHVHSDAWLLSEEGLQKFIHDLKSRNKFVAVRGVGLGDVYKPGTSNHAFGQADDHFFAFHREFAEIHDIWRYRVSDMLMRSYSVHGTLMTVLAVKAGLRNIWYYKKLGDCLNCYGEPSTDNEAKPCIYDQEYRFLHLHRGSLPGDWGQSLQAWFLDTCLDQYTPPESIRQFIHNYYDPDIQDKIRKENVRLNKKLRLRLYPKMVRGKTRVNYKILLLDHFKLSTLLKNMKKRVFKYVYKKIFPDVDVYDVYAKLNEPLDDDWTKVWNE